MVLDDDVTATVDHRVCCAINYLFEATAGVGAGARWPSKALLMVSVDFDGAAREARSMCSCLNRPVSCDPFEDSG